MFSKYKIVAAMACLFTISPFLPSLCFSAPPFKVGVLLDLTGLYSEFGNNTKDMLLKSVDQIGTKNGIGLKLIIEDYGLNFDRAVLGLQKLVVNEKVDAIIGPLDLASARVTMEANNNRFKIPQFILSDTGLINKAYSSVFSTMPTIIMRLVVLSEPLKSNKTKIFVPEVYSQLIDGRIESGTVNFYKDIPGINNELEKLPENSKLNLVFLIRPFWRDKNIQEFDRNLVRLQKANIFFVDPRDPYLWMSTAYPRRQGIHVVVPKYQFATYSSSELRTKTRDFRQWAGQVRIKAPSISAVAAYDALTLLSHAFRIVGKNPPGIVEDIQKLKNFLGVSGYFSFSKENHIGLGPQNFTMTTVKEDGCINDQNECSKCLSCCADKEDDCVCEKCK